MQVSRWGNSLAVRLPAELVRELGLVEGDTVTLSPARSGRARGSTPTLEVRRRDDREALVEQLRGLRWSMPKDFAFDREDANARGGSR